MITPSWVDRQVGDFQIEERIGRGGSASVYRALQVSMNRYVALKIIDIDPSEYQHAFRRFSQEVEVIASLEHLHVLPIYGFGTTEDEYAFFATRLMHQSLADMLRPGEPLPLSQARRIFLQAASGLHYAHVKGIIHRDIKPSNILLDETGNAYIADFGLAQFSNVTLDLSETSPALVGTPTYISPEQLLGDPASQLSDQYSLGVVLYHMLAGRPPFESNGRNLANLLYRHVQEIPRPLHEVNENVPEKVGRVVMRALAKNPKERYISVEEMATEFKRAIEDSGEYPIVQPRKPVTPLRRALPAAMLALLVLLTLVITQRSQMFTSSASGFQILPGETGTIDSLTPDEGDFTAARQALGETGFIAYFSCTLQSSFQSGRAGDLSLLASEHQMPLRVYNSQNDPYLQMIQIEQARLQGAKAFIVCPLDSDLMIEAAQSLEKAGLPLVFATSFNHDYGLKLDPDNHQIGVEIGSYAGQIIRDELGGQANVVLLGLPGSLTSEQRIRGMRAALAETAPDATVIDEREGFTRDGAYAAIKELIASGTAFDAVLSINDNGAMGVVDALEEAGIDLDDVFIVSANGERAVREYVEEGYFVRGTVPVDRLEGSRLLLYGAVMALAGNAVPEYLRSDIGAMVTAEPTVVLTDDL